MRREDGNLRLRGVSRGTVGCSVPYTLAEMLRLFYRIQDAK
jgi:hypothetical protein